MQTAGHRKIVSIVLTKLTSHSLFSISVKKVGLFVSHVGIPVLCRSYHFYTI